MNTGVTRHGVWLYDTRVGFLHHHDNYTWFEFSDAYLEDAHRPVLGLRFEHNIYSRVAANLHLPQWFSNLLPEGVLRTWIATERRVSPDREMELLAQVGQDLPGAVRVLPAPEESTDDLAVPDISNVVAEGTREGRMGWRFSLAGVGLKFSMLRSGNRFTCTASGAGGDWIMKLPDAVFRHVPLNEYTMMRFAGAVGIEVPEVVLVHRDEIDALPPSAWPGTEQWAFAVRRFDRPEGGQRVHIEDLAQVRGVYPVSKYEGNYETVAGLVYRGHDEVALREFVRRLTFFVLIGNGDAHLKNWSLIYRDRRVPTLSPAYDIVSTETYRPDGSAEDLGLKFAGSRRFESVRVHHFDRFEHKLGTRLDLADIAAQTVRSTVEAWPRFANELVAAPSIRDAIGGAVVERATSLMGGRPR